VKAPLETALPPLPAPSDRAQPSFRWERFAFVAHETPPLFEQHWREVALNKDAIRLDPDWDRYFQLDAAGVLQILTVRVEGKLVGYHFVFIYPHLHYFSTSSAETDMFYLTPEYRQGLTGYNLLRFVRDGLKQHGVKQHSIRTKLHIQSFEPLLRRLGYRPIETVYCKLL
jgi:hypothetical protein